MSEHSHGKAVLGEVAPLGRTLREQIPEVYSSFAKLSSTSMAEGALSAKTKELIALSISISRQCDGCIAQHAKGASRKGATRDEVAEAIGVAIFLNGGPSTVYGPRAYDAFCEFADARDERDTGASA